jgi:hypothetical protein
MRMKILTLGLIVWTMGCATQFHGSPRFPGGPKGCYDKCATSGMQMTSFVYVGEYSTGCVCGMKGHAGRRASADASQPATAAASVGVVLQMREQARQQQAQQSMMNH